MGFFVDTDALKWACQSCVTRHCAEMKLCRQEK